MGILGQDDSNNSLDYSEVNYTNYWRLDPKIVRFYSGDSSIPPLSSWVSKNQFGDELIYPTDAVNYINFIDDEARIYDWEYDLTNYDYWTASTCSMVILFKKNGNNNIERHCSEDWIIPKSDTSMCSCNFSFNTWSQVHDSWLPVQIAISFLPRDFIIEKSCYFMWKNSSGEFEITNFQFKENGIIDVPEEIQKSNDISLRIFFKKPFANSN
jgi:hypothetical protein